MTDLRALETELLAAVASANDEPALETVRVAALGRSGSISALLKTLGTMSPEARKEQGPRINGLKDRVTAAIAARRDALKELALDQRLNTETLDVTLPGNRPRIGHRHPLTIVWKEIEDIFISMGYTVEDGPEVESTYYNFDALNIPQNHPARDPRDTFYVAENMLLRTHTSPVQVRTMEKMQPPVRIICPGRVFRRDPLDPTHSPMFHQVEGLLVDEGITFGDLKGTLERFHKQFFGEKTKTRLRPSFFPFVEPGAEVDVSCVFCDQAGCRVCKGTGWVEVMGAGMVHPVVLRNGGYDPATHSGFAFCMGPERIAMLTYALDDIRQFWANDLRFLGQF